MSAVTQTIDFGTIEKRTSDRSESSDRYPSSLLLRALGVASRLAPRLTADLLARRLLTTRPRPNRGRELAWLATAQRAEVHLGEHTIPVWSWGHGHSVLLVHGWNGSAGQLTRFVKPLVERGFRAVAFDNVGHAAEGVRRATMVDLARGIGAVGRAVGPFHAVIAHSMGGPCTTVALAEGLAVKRLAYLAPPADPARWAREFGARAGLSGAILSAIEARIEHRAGRTLAELRDIAIAGVADKPLMLVHDETDRHVPWSEVEELAVRRPDACVVRTTGLGHNRLLENADTIRRVVGFVTQPQR